MAVTKRLRFEILRRDNHRPEGGHCGDPVCKVIYAGLLIGDVMAAMGAKDRAQKVLDEAEALLDG